MSEACPNDEGCGKQLGAFVRSSARPASKSLDRQRIRIGFIGKTLDD